MVTKKDENRIEVTIDVNILNSQPYYLNFEYVGDLDFKKRLLAISNSEDYLLEIDTVMFNWISVSFMKKPYHKRSHFYYPNLEALLDGEISWSLRFEKIKHAEIARLKAEKELNIFITKEWVVYKDLCNFKNHL